MTADRHRLRRMEQKIRELERAGKPDPKLKAQWETRLIASLATAAQRLARLPKPGFPEELPVSAKRGEIAAAIAENQVVIVCGETGSGKTTQLPKICLELGRGVYGLIGHTQPRRLAARTVAARIAQELNAPLGQTVGYKVRFNDNISSDSYVKLMTDGILLAETQHDRFLSAYDTIIIDEAHERSLNIDFLLGYLKQLLPKRPDLKVIVTSATIDAQRFSGHFNGAPVIEVSGRLYPVEIRYRPLKIKEGEEAGEDLQDAILDAVDDLARLPQGGDILVFLPGEREIRDTAEALRKHHPAGSEILPLYARLSAAEQERIFKPGGGRRIVLATNVAETSLTVPGIRYVIDPGTARLLRYSYRAKVERLQVENISQASANQRAGRCGRVMSGVCVRLYTAEDFAARPAYTDPEIKRSNLAAAILRMKALGLSDIENFPFIEPPDSRAIADGFKLLEELNAVDGSGALTPLGDNLAKLPIDPRIGRMVLAAKEENCLAEILVIASALEAQDPRDRPLERQQAADEAHRRFSDEHSDFLSYLKLWTFYDEALKHQKSRNKLNEWCRQHFLSPARLREWRELHGQLHAVVTEMGWRENQVEASYDEIHRALLAGLLGNIGFKSDTQEYDGARGIKFSIFPGSGQFKKNPKWVMAAELAETTKLYARTVAKIEPEWLEKVGAHLLRRHYFDPHWEKQPAQVSAFERVTLYGITVTPKRRVHYGPLNPVEAREIFLRSALAAGEFNTRAPFFEHNRKLLAEIEELEHKSRRQDVLVDEQALFEFYDARVAAGIHNGVDFEKWRREAEKTEPRLLFMTRDDLMRHGAETITEAQFPETLTVGDSECRLTYRFEPGHPLDGATLSVPLHLLNQLDGRQFEWLTPGMLREKITWLVKALPKRVRAACVPVPDFVTAALTEISPAQPSLLVALTTFILRKTAQEVPADAWKEADIPAHLRMNLRIIDEAGAEMASGRDLIELKAKLGQAARLTFARAPELDFERTGLTAWDFGDLPEKITFTRNNHPITGYPALVDEGASVAIRLFDTPEAANLTMRGGARRLLRLALATQMKQLEKSLPGFTQTAMQLRAIAPPDDLREDLLTAIADRAFLGEDEPPRSEKQFAAQKDRAKTRLSAVSDAACRLTATIAADYLTVQARLPKLPAPLAADLREQLAHLVYKGFIEATPWAQLSHLPRYLQAILRRLDKLPNERDARHMAIAREWWQTWQKRVEKHRKEGAHDPAMDEFRWMMEELRVSLFAQELKTPYPVSAKRLQKVWEGIKP
ncbi:MAG: ATP-dependent RNA helicase HrpA [Sulfuricellaceae bacterium]